MSSQHKKSLRFVVSGALLVGSLAACQGEPNEPHPETNVGHEEPVSNDPAPNEQPEAEPASNEQPEAEPEVFSNEVYAEEPTGEPEGPPAP